MTRLADLVAPLAPRAPFTPQQARIALLITDRRNFSYAEIGAQLEPPISERRVKAHVQRMSAQCFDRDTRDAHPPRVQVLVWVRHLEWALGREPTLSDLIQASGEADV